jgi:hypothetical protein
MQMLALTILHHLLPEYPILHRRLQEERLLPAAMEHFGRELQERQRHWQAMLSHRTAPQDQISLASESRELALHELQDRLSQSDPDALLSEVKASRSQEE